MAPPSDNFTSFPAEACHPHACAIQACMQRTMDQAKCQDLIDGLYRCCDRFYKKYGEGEEADACPIKSVLDRKLKAMGEEKR